MRLPIFMFLACVGHVVFLTALVATLGASLKGQAGARDKADCAVMARH